MNTKTNDTPRTVRRPERIEDEPRYVVGICSKTALGKWGWRRFNSGKPKLKVLCAVGHKLLTYAWHIMLDHPTPNRDSEAMFLRKLGSSGFLVEIGAIYVYFIVAARAFKADVQW